MKVGMREMILAVLRTHGTVRFPLKFKPGDESDTAEVGWFVTVQGKGKFFTNDARLGYDYYETADAAADAFMRRVFTKKNIGLAYAGIVARGMIAGRMEDLTLAELAGLVRDYHDRYWATDYPFAEW